MAFSGSEADFLATTSGITLDAFHGNFFKLSSVYRPATCIITTEYLREKNGVEIWQ